MTCNPCDGTGIRNAEYVRASMWTQHHQGDLPLADLVRLANEENPDVTVCDCCGDGDDWYGEPGRHYTRDDPPGPRGPYASNGGLCKCH